MLIFRSKTMHQNINNTFLSICVFTKTLNLSFFVKRRKEKVCSFHSAFSSTVICLKTTRFFECSTTGVTLEISPSLLLFKKTSSSLFFSFLTIQKKKTKSFFLHKFNHFQFETNSQNYFNFIQHYLLYPTVNCKFHKIQLIHIINSNIFYLYNQHFHHHPIKIFLQKFIQ